MKSIKSQDGFIIIVGLMMMLMMAVLAIGLQTRNIEAMQSISNSHNRTNAGDIADSTIEYLRFQLKNKGAGYNLDKFTCTFKKGSGTPRNMAEEADCPVFEEGMLLDADISVTASIKGRNNDGESLSDCGSLGFTDCYVVPALGTGTAGKNCEFYTPGISPSATTKFSANGQAVSTTETGTAQIDYSCNWNKLTFGSSLTDRAAIPFYYSTTTGTISPFNSEPAENGGTQATDFVVRIRPPCKPTTTNGTTTTPSNCTDTDRYVLNHEVDDIVVQWQFSGQCKDDNGIWKECGMIQWAEYGKGKDGKIKLDDYFSGINEGRLNHGTWASYPNLENLYNYNLAKADDSKYRMIYPELYGTDTNSYDKAWILKKAISYLSGAKMLPTMRAPILTLFLSNKLISEDGKNIPYLEYQVLTDEPIGDSRIKMEVVAEVNGSIIKKTLYKEEQKALIDFAVQN